jgi:signal transduction histidine kinase
MDLPDKTKSAFRWTDFSKLLTFDYFLTGLTVVFIASFHHVAADDRLLLNLYYIGIAGASYCLAKRRAFSLMVLLLALAAGTTMANVYFSGSNSGGDPLLDPVRDLAGWIVLLFLFWRLGVEAYRFQTEERHREIQRALKEKSIQMRAAALTCTSHEFRTPLSAILSINETLLSESVGEINDTQREFLRDIDDSANHLMNLVNDVLDYAKAEAGLIQLTRERVAIVELIEQCVAKLQPRAEKAQVSFAVHIEPEIDEIVADPLRLKQILMVLLANAINYNEPNGMVHLRLRGDDTSLLISVRDTGRGIAPEQLPHLFDPYYQAARGDQGVETGLGLSILKHLTELHGGEVTVDSVVDAGSVFAVSLPRNVLPDAPSESTPRADLSSSDPQGTLRSTVDSSSNSEQVLVS